MNEIYFLVRYTPFWAIPIMLMGAEFAYLFWRRKKKKTVTFCLSFVGISFTALIYYYWAGGPERSVQRLIDLIRYYS